MMLGIGLDEPSLKKKLLHYVHKWMIKAVKGKSQTAT